jgi:hypothetical protein
MLKKNLRRLLVATCVAGAFATAAPAYADTDAGSSGQAVIAMNGGGGSG